MSVALAAMAFYWILGQNRQALSLAQPVRAWA